MNKSKRVFESLLIILVVILSIPAVSESNNIIPRASSISVLSTISLDPTSGSVGTTVTVTGSLFFPSSDVTVSYDGTAVATNPSTITTDLTGGFTATFTVPASAAGSHIVSAKDTVSDSASAQFIVTSSATPPSAPQNLQATGGNARVSLSWQAPSSNGGSAITYYKIYRSNSSGTEVYLTTRGNVTSYTDLAVTNGNTYFYKVSALNSIGESPKSNEASATTSGTISTPPSTSNKSTPNGANNTLSGIYKALTQNGSTTSTDSTQVTFTLNNGQLYSVEPTDFSPYFVEHWKDTGLADNPRAITINGNTQIMAVYRTTAISLTPSTGPAGTSVTVAGNSFSPNSHITISYDGTPLATNPAAITTSSSGTFSATFTVPVSAAGSHVIQVDDGGSHTYSDLFTVGSSATILLTPTVSANGSPVKVTGTGFAPYSKITMYYDNMFLSNYTGTDQNANPLVYIMTDSAGGFVGDLQVPYSSAGSHDIRVTDKSNTDTKTITVTPASLLFGPATGHVGTTVNFHGSGFAANSGITISFDGSSVTTSPSGIISSPEGEFMGSLAVPNAATVGAHLVKMSDTSGNTYSTSFTVTSSTTPAFSVQNIVTGLGTGFAETDGIAFIPDNGPGKDGSGDFMVLEKNGTVVVVKNNGGTFVKQSIPFVTVPTVQGYYEDAGLLGIALDPNWINTKFVYFYATESVNGVLQNQVLRYTATTDSSGNIVAVPNSEQLIIGGIPAIASHNAGHMKFDSHGNLYVSTGDDFKYFPGQDITSLDGKLLRITPLGSPGSNGLLYSIPSTNPFASSADPNIRKEIYSYGLRNAFSFDIDSQTGKIYLSMVGHNTWETILDSTSPANFGWPNYEGPTIGNPQQLANYKEPVYWYPHAGMEPTSGVANGLEAILGGAFYHCSATCYPSQYQDAYFFGDYAIGYIVALESSSANPPQTDPATGVPRGQVQTTVTGLYLGPIDMAVWNGKLDYVDLVGNVAGLHIN